MDWILLTGGFFIQPMTSSWIVKVHNTGLEVSDLPGFKMQNGSHILIPASTGDISEMEPIPLQI